ncbi:MAG: hypothetical protein OXC11_02360 [Rhodospirillales bacterium]|nr:hypothetical protein [Rhodospirillales bacterium]
MPDAPKRWTAEEELRLKRLYSYGLNTAAIARKLGRTQWAIERRACDMRIRGIEIPYADQRRTSRDKRHA